MKPAVFLDRDGVINTPVVRDGQPYPPSTAADVTLLDGVAEACSLLSASGFLLIVATNQPDVARGTQTQENVEAINAKVRQLVAVDDICVCWHTDSDDCVCRKPRPGLLLSAAKQWNIDLARSYMVGDRWKDVEAGRRAGCATVLVDWGYSAAVPVVADSTVRDLAEAAEWILSRDHAGAEEGAWG
jgi:D-glycero-D-manno-heptose 1,7-bisphosphate phosphatase